MSPLPSHTLVANIVVAFLAGEVRYCRFMLLVADIATLLIYRQNLLWNWLNHLEQMVLAAEDLLLELSHLIEEVALIAQTKLAGGTAEVVAAAVRLISVAVAALDTLLLRLLFIDELHVAPPVLCVSPQIRTLLLFQQCAPLALNELALTRNASVERHASHPLSTEVALQTFQALPLL